MNAKNLADNEDTKLTKKQQGQLKTLSKLDNDGDGEISLMEIIALEEHLEDTEKQNKRMKRILCAIMLGLFMFLGAMMCMGIAAIEITKESRVRDRNNKHASDLRIPRALRRSPPHSPAGVENEKQQTTLTIRTSRSNAT